MIAGQAVLGGVYVKILASKTLSRTVKEDLASRDWNQGNEKLCHDSNKNRWN